MASVNMSSRIIMWDDVEGIDSPDVGGTKLVSEITPSFSYISVLDRSDIFAAGDPGSLYHYDGDVWTMAKAFGRREVVSGIWYKNKSELFTLVFEHEVDGGSIYQFDGSNWAKIYHHEKHFLYSIWGYEDHLFIVGDGGILVHYDGSQWTESFLKGESSLLSVHGIHPGCVAVAGTEGKIAYYRDDNKFHPVAKEGEHDWYTVWCASEDDLLTVGSSGCRNHFFKGKLTGTHGSNYGSYNMLSVYGTSPDNIVCGGQNRTLLRYNGSVWEAIEWTESNGQYDSYQINGVWCDEESNILAVGGKRREYSEDNYYSVILDLENKRK